ncbi:MAG: tRNA glutamyl-Q(34) synthetase GluQRS [Alphaproteobacteria bacterium]|nr:tRNA glutamyl-Q(34) synthetase GluQRS [Alphaproteobacteria bacterium]
MTAETTRFAPSPTGRLHIGHAYAALYADKWATITGGRFLLRIEDIDETRARKEFEEGITGDLAWLGLRWETPVRRQSEHFDEYAAALGRLKARGLLYRCFCTRADLAAQAAAIGHAPHGPQLLRYPGTCRALSDGEANARAASGAPFALRLDGARALQESGSLTFVEQGETGLAGTIPVDPERIDDVVLARKDTPASYHLCVVLDDALQQVSLVTRGADLLEATHLHRLLQAVLGLPAPRYAHHRLITDESGKRFAKRDNAVTLSHLRDEGLSAAALRQRLGF